MALFQCPECGAEISDKTETCPNCGYGVQTYYTKIELEKQKAIHEENTTKFKEEIISTLKNKKIVIPSILIVCAIVIGGISYKVNHKEVIHGISWGMSVSEVEKKEKSFSGIDGYYNAEHNYYGVSPVDFFGKDACILYIFDEDKLVSIGAIATYDTYEEAYGIAYNICKEHNLPVSFKDQTDDKYSKSSVLTWNIEGTTIDLVGSYDSPNSRRYTFLLKPYEGREFGEKYEEKGICKTGSALSWGACKNEISPWNTDGHCYKHGCYVMGCPNGIFPLHDYNTVLCKEHFFLSE